KEARLVTAFAGSAQHMMHGLALDESSPLYGRAGETFRLGPLPAGHIQVVSGSKAPSSSLRHYATFGGIPRYWELAEPFKGDLDAAIDALVLDPMGPLHTEPDRLLAMEIPQATTLRPLLDVIGAGAHRVSEIGGRIGIPATSLSRPLTRLAELGFIKKEKPFGDPERGSKRTLYKLADPFLRMWFKTVAPRRALLASATKAARLRIWRQQNKGIFAEAFEDLARASISRLSESHSSLSKVGPFGPAGRYWEPGGKEWDIVSLSEDGTKILLCEVKWSGTENHEKTINKATMALLKKGMPSNSQWENLEPVFAVFVPKVPRQSKGSAVTLLQTVHHLDVTDILRVCV
ncbi:MAG: ATP-binding protein, partial [Proteobacteria bacterium]|nr:ATP-binding protein [Pseudomonadota bacterium]